MRKILYILLAAMMAGMAWGQDIDTDSIYYARRDSLRAIDRDTASAMLNLHTIGDVIFGFDLDIEPCYPEETYTVNDTSYYVVEGETYTYVNTKTIENKHRNAIRFYHKDKHGKRVRQIVVLQERWPNLPADLATCGETYGESMSEYDWTGLAGFKLAALTPKELEVAKRLGDVWGEIFEVSYPRGYPYWSDQKDTIPNYPGVEIVCYSDSITDIRTFVNIGGTQRRYTRELMNYTDSITGLSYQCAAPNRTTGQADYTLEASNGKYETRWMMTSPAEQAYWMRKYKKYYGLEKPYISM